jgi:hypothetical protein
MVFSASFRFFTASGSPLIIVIIAGIKNALCPSEGLFFYME